MMTIFERSQFTHRMLSFLSVFSKIYAIAMILLSVAAGSYFLGENRKMEVITVGAVLLIHAVCQLIYSFHSSLLLDMKEFEEHTTIDNDMLFGAEEGEVKSIAGWAVAMAAVASFIELGLAFMGVRFMSFIVGADYGDTGNILAALILAIGLVGGLASAFYNVRTWNMKRVNTRKGV